MAYHSFCPDLALLNKEIKPEQGTGISRFWCLEEQTTLANIPNAGNIFAPSALPVNPYLV
jgi:hypothetical protein